jgi:intracellular multiplication protein IcmB
VAIRNRLYTRLGAAQARRLLGANFPGGSARNELKRRVAELSDRGKAEEANVGAVIEKICEEMIALTKVKIEDIQAPKSLPSK